MRASSSSSEMASARISRSVSVSNGRISVRGGSQVRREQTTDCDGAASLRAGQSMARLVAALCLDRSSENRRLRVQEVARIGPISFRMARVLSAALGTNEVTSTYLGTFEPSALRSEQ